MKRLLIDMDEVIADTTSGMVAWYKEKLGGDIDYAKMLEGQSLVKGFPEEHQPVVRQQFFEPGFFRNLPVMEDSISVVEELNKKYEVFIVSAATEFPNSLTEKYYWLMEHFPFFHWQQLVLCGVKSMIEADIMIDDHVRHLKNFRGKPWLFTAPHNLNETGFDRIDGWKDAALKLL